MTCKDKCSEPVPWDDGMFLKFGEQPTFKGTGWNEYDIYFRDENGEKLKDAQGNDKINEWAVSENKKWNERSRVYYMPIDWINYGD